MKYKKLLEAEMAKPNYFVFGWKGVPKGGAEDLIQCHTNLADANQGAKNLVEDGYDMVQLMARDGVRIVSPKDIRLERDVSGHPLSRQVLDLCHAIESCGASEKITEASCKASDLYKSITEMLYQCAACQAEPAE